MSNVVRHDVPDDVPGDAPHELSLEVMMMMCHDVSDDVRHDAPDIWDADSFPLFRRRKERKAKRKKP